MPDVTEPADSHGYHDAMPHALTSNLVHCVFSTKDRANSIAEPQSLWRFLAGVARAKNIPLIIAGGTPNHVHLLIALPAATCLAKAVQDLKGNSSRWMNQQGSAFAWQEGYGAFSVSASNKQAVTDYIAEQPRHHEKRSFEQEFTAMLRHSGVAYDPRFIFG
ncbi:MAG TPA: transposase [Terriglobales bacterium]